MANRSKKNITINLDPKLWEQFKIVAIKHGLSYSLAIERFLWAYTKFDGNIEIRQIEPPTMEFLGHNKTPSI